ncbi:protein IQ-DOMAIN 1-like [Phoenix dactylifera]|uniref:Protein IQ-DOMAIN 1-like n=1 Tax=Phoenix dactylifera TaxID=42345 RepID=A0A8B7C5B2_PHODC|nr:protein IQ-DOMAIN 1-like [Phoenix dactylifera]
MGRKSKWFGAVKRVFSPESKEKKREKSKKKSLLETSKNSDPCPPEPLENAAPVSVPPHPPLPQHEEVKAVEAENEQNNRACSVVQVTAAAAEAAAAAGRAAAEVVRLTTAARFPGKSREEIAAIKIQTAFRGYLARRALRALRGLVRLKYLIDGNSVKRQATTTLRCMQTLARVQSQIRSRRIRMLEENQALQRQLLLKRERELESLRRGEEWDDRIQSKEQIEASLLSKQEAAIRRERALAYAFSHQWKNSSRSAAPMFMDPNNPQWGWSWLERWMVARPWESQSTTDRELNSDHASVKSTSQSIGGGEIIKAYARRDSNLERPSPTTQKLNRPTSRQSPSTPNSKTSLVVRKIKSASPKTGWSLSEDDSRSIVSIQSERPRRHSLAWSSFRDDESLASSPATPSYMAPTESARAKTRFQSPLNDKIEASDTGSVGSVKKRLSFPVGDKNGVTSPAGVRRHSGPPKVDIASIKDVEVHADHKTSNGVSR